MSPTDLDSPLGRSPDPDPTRNAPIREAPWGAIALSGMGLIAASLVAFVIVTDRTKPDAPPAIASLESFAPKRISVSEFPPAAAPRQTEAVTTIGRTIRTTPPLDFGRDLQTASRIGADATATAIARTMQSTRTALAPAPDPRLVEHGPHGDLPRIGRDGSRPADVYAHPAQVHAKLPAGAPRLSIVVTGMGLDRQATERAIVALPPAVTLAFAPYGEDLERQAHRARSDGHELLLQSDLEGFDGRAGSGRRALDTLHWEMSRFSGYVGLTNVHAPSPSRQALAPVMEEIAGRGLVFLGDASSLHAAFSVAGAPSARADVIIDAFSGPEVTDSALRRLELIARDRGAAIGVVHAPSQGVDRVSRFAQGLEARGVVLAPLSALIQAPARTSAR